MSVRKVHGGHRQERKKKRVFGLEPSLFKVQALFCFLFFKFIGKEFITTTTSVELQQLLTTGENLKTFNPVLFSVPGREKGNEKGISEE